MRSLRVIGIAVLLLTTPMWGVEWKQQKGFRNDFLNVPIQGKTGFTVLPEASTGIRFTNHLADKSVAENQIRLIGSGVALGDVDGDGLCDIYLCRLEGPNALYRNLGGWKFEDIAGQVDVACAEQYSTGCALADLDGDSDLDLLVNSIGGGTRRFFNDGKGRFTERNSGLLRKFCATSMALADIDGNGTLDLYVTNYRTNTIRSTGLQVLNVNGRRMLRPQDRESYEITSQGLVLEHAEPDVLYLNDGKGDFTPLPWTGGNFIDADGKPLTRGDKDWGLSVMMRDMNGDGAPDIYVCNDFWSEDAIWINDGKGKFHALSKLAMRNSSTFSMGVDFADIDRDGLDDFVVLDMRSREHARRMTQRSMIDSAPTLTKIDERPQMGRNTLFLNRGDGTYAEIAQLAGLQASEWSWCPVFLDIDLDGYEDLLVTTGHGFDPQDSDVEEQLARRPRPPSEKYGERILHYPRLNVPNQAFRNRGDLTFEPAGHAWGFNAIGVAHGMAVGDLDGDGDLDVVVNNLNGLAGIYRNDAIGPRVAVRLKGKAPNTRGIGATIKLEGGPVSQSQELISGGRYLSSDDPQRVFAAVNITNRFTITVRWRSGAVSVVTNVAANSIYEIDEAETASPNPKIQSQKPAPLFADVSAALGHVHREEPFDDFARQPLLSKRLSHGGPGIAWADFDGDDKEDLIVGGGRGGEAAFYRNSGDGKFERTEAPADISSGGDQTTVLGWKASGGTQVLLGCANYETAATNASSAVRLEFRASRFESRSSLPALPASTGPMALADIDGDGDLDLFIGGQVNAGRYPEAATSRLFRNDDSIFILSQELKEIGLVNGAVFTDLDGDGFPELVLACEWDTPKIFRSNKGGFAEADVGLGKYRGWWQGITAGDFDGDGRMDIAASNWGRNSPYQLFVRDGIRVYYGDFTGAGRIDGVEAYMENGRVVPWRDLETLSRVLPWLRQKYSSNHAFAQASIAEILGTHMARAKELRVNWLDSTVFLNRGDHFEPRSLPIEAQFAPAFGVCAGDFDGDGNEDIFLAQNFFATDGETSRYDAGRGLLLRGNGRGGFATIPAQQSGLLIYGEQRGAAVCDYDGDGRLDLAVGQNSAETKLFHNETATPGVRVHLRGVSENKAGIGAVIRRVNGTARGPAHEIHAGSGYWSQDSSTVILSGSGNQVWVRWRGSKEHVVTLPAGARDLILDVNGAVELSR